MIEASGTNGALRFNFEFCASHKTSYYYMQFVNKLREKLFFRKLIFPAKSFHRRMIEALGEI